MVEQYKGRISRVSREQYLSSIKKIGKMPGIVGPAFRPSIVTVPNLLPHQYGPAQTLAHRYERTMGIHDMEDALWGKRGLHPKYKNIGFHVVKKDGLRPATMIMDFGLDAAAKMSGFLGYGSPVDAMLPHYITRLAPMIKERMAIWIEHVFDSRGDPPMSWRPYRRYSRAFSDMRTKKKAISHEMYAEVQDPTKPHIPDLVDTGALRAAMRKEALMKTINVWPAFGSTVAPIGKTSLTSGPMSLSTYKDLRRVQGAAGGSIYGFVIDIDNISPRDPQTGYEYAWAHEFGTSRLPARPFVFPGVAIALNEVAGAVNYNMRQAVERGADIGKASPETSVLVYPWQVSPGGAFSTPSVSTFRPAAEAPIITMPTGRLTAYALMWWLLPPSRIWAVIGGISDISAIMSGELLQARYLRPWMQNFMLGKISTKVGVPLTKKFARRGFRRKMYRGRGKYKKRR